MDYEEKKYYIEMRLEKNIKFFSDGTEENKTLRLIMTKIAEDNREKMKLAKIEEHEIHHKTCTKRHFDYKLT